MSENVSAYYQRENKNVLKAERQGLNTLILIRNQELYAACDGRLRRFRIEYLWHPSEAAPLSSVMGSEVTYFGHREVKGWQKKSLFDLFQVF